jgi:hypothetical protein
MEVVALGGVWGRPYRLVRAFGWMADILLAVVAPKSGCAQKSFVGNSLGPRVGKDCQLHRPAASRDPS